MTNRYDELSERARWFLNNFDEIDLADMCASQEASLAVLRAVARSYRPACGRGDAAPSVADWEQQKQRADQAEAELARAVQRAERAEAALSRAVQRAEVWQDAPDPLARAMAADLASTIRGSQPPARDAGPAVAECAEVDGGPPEEKQAGRQHAGASWVACRQRRI